MKEDYVTRITARADLCGLTLANLQALHHTVAQELLSTQPGSAAWRDALTSLDIGQPSRNAACATPADRRPIRNPPGCGISVAGMLTSPEQEGERAPLRCRTGQPHCLGEACKAR